MKFNLFKKSQINKKKISLPIINNFPEIIEHESTKDDETFITENDKTSDKYSNYYIFNNRDFEKSINKNELFDIFNKPELINSKSCETILPELITYLVKNLHKIPNYQMIFSPNLNQLNTNKLLKVKSLIRDLFPYNGCSLKSLNSFCLNNNFEDLIIIFRILLTLLPNGLMTGQEFENFDEPKKNFKDLLKIINKSNYKILNYYLSLIKNIWNVNQLNFDELINLINLSSCLCFQTPQNQNFQKDIFFYKQFYLIRNQAMIKLFQSYLTNCNEKLPFLNDFLEFKNLDNYLNPYLEFGLVISLPSNLITKNNLNDLILKISQTNSLIYSNDNLLYFDEEFFLRNFLKNPYLNLKKFLTKLSLNYLKIFDNDDELYENINQGSDINNSYKNNDINNSLKISKIILNNWFFNTWKYETSIGNLNSTFIFELNEKIGQINWLIITTDNYSLNNNGIENIDPELLLLNEILLKNNEFQKKNNSFIDILNDDNKMFIINEIEELLHEKLDNESSSSNCDNSFIRNLEPITPIKNPEPITPIKNNLNKFDDQLTPVKSFNSLLTPIKNIEDDLKFTTPVKKIINFEHENRKRKHSQRDLIDYQFDENLNDGFEDVFEEEISYSMLKTSPKCSSLKELLV